MGNQTNNFFDLLCERYEECYDYLHDASELLKRFDGVVGVGIGPKLSGGRLIPEQPCFMVYVEEKKFRAELDARELIPTEVLGIKTDVVAIGSRASDAHNEFDARWLKWSREGFASFCIPGEESYRHVS
jgi:hypothetical protein